MFIPLGYLYKQVTPRPANYDAPPHVLDFYTLSGCLAAEFCDYIPHWRHNGWWLFDAPEIMQEVAREAAVDLTPMTLFYYEAYEFEYHEHAGTWRAFEPEPGLPTAIVPPARKRLEGYDVATFSCGTAPECSPLCCNYLCRSVETNEHCLLPTFERAKELLEQHFFDNSETGPFRIIAVYTVAS